MVENVLVSLLIIAVGGGGLNTRGWVLRKTKYILPATRVGEPSFWGGAKEARSRKTNRGVGLGGSDKHMSQLRRKHPRSVGGWVGKSPEAKRPDR